MPDKGAARMDSDPGTAATHAGWRDTAHRRPEGIDDATVAAVAN